MKTKIHWYKTDPDQGYWRSMEGRFDIAAGSYWGGTKPTSYVLRDRVTGMSYRRDTVAEVKREAVEIVSLEREKEENR